MTDDNVPICGFCGLPQKWHTPQDHAFNQVGGGRVVEYPHCIDYDIRCPKPERIRMSPRQKLLMIVTLAGLAWLIIGALWRWV